MPPDLLRAFSRQAYDAAIVSTLCVNAVHWLSGTATGVGDWGKAISLNNGTSYLRTVLGDEQTKQKRQVAHERVQRADGLAVFEVCACVVSPEEAQRLDELDAKVIGFVNGVRCSAGTHMELATRRITDTIRKQGIG